MSWVRLNDFPALWALVYEEALRTVDQVGRSGCWVLGTEVQAFEEELAASWGLPNCIGCASGTDAIEIALRCAGLEPGEGVVTTPLSAFATSLAIVRAGGLPIFVDVDDSGLIDLDDCEARFASEPELRFMVPVHLYGHALDLDHLARLRDRFSLCIVEDCAQAIGAASRASVWARSATSRRPASIRPRTSAALVTEALS